MSFGQGFSLIITFFSITLAAYYLGVSDFGLFSSINAMVVIISKVTDLGFAPIVIREGTKDIRDFRLLNTSITIRLVLLLLSFVLFNLIAILAHTDRTMLILSDIMFLNLVISLKYQNIRDLMDTIFKIDLRMHYSMSISILDNLLFLLAVLLMPVFSGDIYYLTLGYVLANLPGFFVVMIIIKRQYGFKYSFSFYNTRWLLKESLPMWGFILLTSVFQQIDLIFLKYFDSNYAAGIYSAAMRLSTTLGIIPYAISTTIFPMIMKNKSGDPSKNDKLIRIVHKILFYSAFSIALICTFEAKGIVSLLFGEKFAPASVPMIFLLWSQIFLFYSYFSVDIFTAYNAQKYNFLYASFVLVLNVILMFVFIPGYSYSGIAAAKIIASLTGALLIVVWMRNIRIKTWFLNAHVLFFCMPLALLLYAISTFLPIYAYGVSSVIVLIIVTKKMKYFSEDEIITIMQLFKLERFSKYLL